MILIQGFFVQKIDGLLDIGYVGGEGAVALMRKGIFPFMYAGAIHENGAGVLVGSMLDVQGESSLFDISVDETEIRFYKQYKRYELLGPRSHILYVFDRREENTWVGRWRYVEDPAHFGPTRCVITDVPDELLQGDIVSFLTEHPDGFSPDSVARYAAKHKSV